MLSFLREALIENTSASLVVARAGGGPASELAIALDRWPEVANRLDITVLAVEGLPLARHQRLLRLARQTGARVTFEPETKYPPSRAVLPRLPGPADLVYSMSPFRELGAEDCVALLGCLYESLGPGGVLVVGDEGTWGTLQIAEEEPPPLFARSLSDVVQLARRLSPAPAEILEVAGPIGGPAFLSIRR